MIFTAMPVLPKTILEPTELVTKLWWTKRCKDSYKTLSPEYKELFKEILITIANLQPKDENAHHTITLKGYGKAVEAHLTSNKSANADEVKYGIKRKGDDIIIYDLLKTDTGLELTILNVGGHQILKENYKNINR